MFGESNMETSFTIYKIDSQRGFALWLREPKPGLYVNLEGWDEEGGGKQVQVEGDMGTPMADSCGWMDGRNQHNTLKQLSFN